MNPEKFKTVTHRYLTDPMFHAVVQALGASDFSFSDILDAACLAMHVRMEREIRDLSEGRRSTYVQPSSPHVMALQYLKERNLGAREEEK